MKKGKKRREFAATLKQRVVERMKQGESVTALAREYQVERSRLYDWRDLWDGGRGFQGMVRLPKSAIEEKVRGQELDAAQAQIAELQRKIGEQEMVLDFFRGALQQVNQSKSTNKSSGSRASSGTSGRRGSSKANCR